MTEKRGFVKYTDETEALSCPYGNVKRIITGGDRGSPNIHLVSVTEGGEHYHSAYDENYYVLSGIGTIFMDGASYELCPGAAVYIPAGVVHSLKADPGHTLQFIIFGSPGMDFSDERAKPMKREEG